MPEHDGVFAEDFSDDVIGIVVAVGAREDEDAEFHVPSLTSGGKREEGRGKREEGRGKREEGRGKREEGRGKREEREVFSSLIPLPSPYCATANSSSNCCFSYSRV
jgi:hypothetical protein